MALYEYFCPQCRKGFDLMRPMSDAHCSAACPACGAEAQRIMLTSSIVEHATQGPTGPSKGDSEAGTRTVGAAAATLRIGMIPAFEFERGPRPRGSTPEGSLAEGSGLQYSAASTAVGVPTVGTEEAAEEAEFDLEEDAVPLNMPWLTESQPGGANLWYIRDWGIASMFGYLRGRKAAKPARKLDSGPAATSGSLAETERRRQVSDQQGTELAEMDAWTEPADGLGRRPTFYEWRTAVSIMPWLQETGIYPTEAGGETFNVVGEDPERPGLRPRRDRVAEHSSWIRQSRSVVVGEGGADLAKTSLPAGKRIAEDFPRGVVEAAWRRQGGRCAACGRWLIKEHMDRECATGAWESHHRVPVERGGSHALANCVLLCSGVADCHFNRGHGGKGWAHYAPLDESALLFLLAGSTAATAGTTPVRPKRNLLREVFGIPQVGRPRERPRNPTGGSDSSA